MIHLFLLTTEIYSQFPIIRTMIPPTGKNIKNNKNMNFLKEVQPLVFSLFSSVNSQLAEEFTVSGDKETLILCAK